MTDNSMPSDLEIVARLGEYQLGSVALAADGNELSLTFINDAEHVIVLRLAGLYHASISRHPDERGNWLVGSASLRAIAGELALQDVGFGFSSRTDKRPGSQPITLARFHLEGDVVVDAVSESAIFETIKEARGSTSSKADGA